MIQPQTLTNHMSGYRYFDRRENQVSAIKVSKDNLDFIVGDISDKGFMVTKIQNAGLDYPYVLVYDEEGEVLFALFYGNWLIKHHRHDGVYYTCLVDSEFESTYIISQCEYEALEGQR